MTGEPPNATLGGEGSTIADALHAWHDSREVCRALGSAVSFQVLDAATGDVLARHRESTPLRGASCTKLVTATNTLMTFGSDHRFVTDVLRDRQGTLFLRGGGDPAMEPSTMADLATRVAVAHQTLPRRAGGEPLDVFVDESHFPPFDMPHGWSPSYLPVEVQPVVPLTLREYFGHEPGRAAGEAFAGALTSLGVAAIFRGFEGAHRDAVTIASVGSRAVADLVVHMLQASHNLTAEVLHRQVALSKGHPATWLGAAAAAREVLAGLDRDLAGVTFADGSGLSRDGRLRVDLLTDLLLEAWRGDRHPELRVIYPGGGLPWAGITGTMSAINEWFGQPPADRVRGYIRAKPGTLAGTVALAGVTSLPGQRDRVFAVLANDLPGEAPHLPARRQLELFAGITAGGHPTPAGNALD